MKTLFPLTDTPVQSMPTETIRATVKTVSGPSQTYCKKCGAERTMGLPCPVCDPSKDWPDPVKPKVNWNAHHLDEVDSPLAKQDHVAAIIENVRKIESVDDEMVKVGNRLDRIIAKLTDPDLSDIPADDHRRLEAEDKRDQLQQKMFNLRTDVVNAAALIGAHAQYMIVDHVGPQWDEVLEEISLIVMERVRADVPGILTSEAWQRIAASVAPF